MSSAKQRTTLTNLSEPQQMRELNRQLSWIWDQLLGGLNMKSLSADARGIIESKIGSEELESAIRQSEDEILLEVRKPASAVDTGNGIVINEKGVEISAGDGSQYIRVTDELIDASDIKSPTVSPRYEGRRLLTVNPQATAEQMEAWGIFRSLSDALSTVNGKQLEGKVQINCADGAVMYENVDLAGVCGGEIEINGTDVMLYGSMTIRECSCAVYINKMGVTSAEGCALKVYGGGYVSLWACTLSSAEGDALYMSGAVRAKVVECTLISAGKCAAFVTDAADGHFAQCKGTGVLAVQFASLAAMGTVPDGGCENWGCSLMDASDVIPTRADGEPAVPEVRTVSCEMLHSDSYAAGRFRNWSYPDDQDDDIRQGYTEYAGRIRGCMWFDNAALRAQMSGRIIKQASLRLYAMKGVGRGVAVSVELYGTSMEYEGRSGAPALTASYGIIGSVTPGEVTTITIPTQVVSDLVSGTINALMLYSADSGLYNDRAYSRNYARFAGATGGTADTVPVLTVVAGGAAAAICGRVLCGQTVCGEE